jgi:hypothetical protein
MRTDGRTDRHDEAEKVAFRNFANAPKNLKNLWLKSSIYYTYVYRRTYTVVYDRPLFSCVMQSRGSIMFMASVTPKHVAETQ